MAAGFSPGSATPEPPARSREPTNPFDGLQSPLGGGPEPALAEPALSEPPPSPPPPEPAPEEAPVPEQLPRRGGATEFDFEAGAEPAPASADGSDIPVELARIQLSRAGGGDAKPVEVDPVVEAARRRNTEIFSAFFNVGSAMVVGLAALVAVALVRAPRPLTAADFGFPLVWLALGLDTGAGDKLLVAENVTTGSYPTRGGADAFIVRGLVHNTGNAPHGPLTAVVEVLRRGNIVGRAESVVGLTTGPEEIHSHDSRRNDDLQVRLANKAVAVGVPALTRRPFLAVFPIPAEEADGCTLRVTLSAGVPPGLESAFPPGVLSAVPAPDPEPEPVPAADTPLPDAGTGSTDAGRP